MKTIGRYLVIIISLAGMSLSVDDRFSEMDIVNFLNDMCELHNQYRQKHRVGPLKRTRQMDFVAARILDDMFIGQYNEIHDVYGKNIHKTMYNKYTKLNTSEATNIFLGWYKKGNSYKYFSETSNYESYKEFTQIVWKDTQTFGIALKMTNDKYVVLIVYSPRGNIPGQFTKNVLQRPIIAHINSSLLNRYIYENDKKNFEDYIFDLHNTARTRHGLLLLKRDTKLDVFADFILKIVSSKMYHSHEMYGKNYFERNYDNNTILDKVEAEKIFLEWYSKGENYNYHEEPLNNKAAEFTQIVWNGTKTMGISILREERFYRVLAFYDPPGNIEGKFISNVFIPKDMKQRESSSFIDN